MMHSPRAAALLAATLMLAWSCNRSADANGTNGGTNGGANGPELSGVRKREPVRVLVEPVAEREMVRLLETTTRVESEHQITIFPRASGVVTAIQVEEGDEVAAGAVLAQLDDREAKIARADAEAALAESRANLPKLTLATRESEARIENARLTAEQAQRDHERNLSISKGGPDKPGLLSSKDLEASRLALDRAVSDHKTAELAHQRAKIEEQAAEAAIHRAQLALERSSLELSFMELSAPIGGVIAERTIKVGDTLSAGSAAFVLTDPSLLRVVFYRPQRELPLFRSSSAAAHLRDAPGRDVPGNGHGARGAGEAEPGAEAIAPETADELAASGAGGLEILARAEALPGRTFRGVIERISPTIDPQSGAFRVTARLETGREQRGVPGADGSTLLPGMLVRLEIVTERHPLALVIPKRAIRREGDTNLVFVMRDGVARRVVVEEGLTDEDSVEVLPREGELEAGELVIVVGNRDLEDGDPVQVDETTAGDAGRGAALEGEAAEDPDAAASPESK